MRKLLKWLDEHSLPVLAGFLLVFIPLYPKLPLLDILPGYIVRVRLEDFFVTFTVLLWILTVLRGKTRLFENPLVKPVTAYLIVGLLSMASAIFITKTVPLESIHIQKMILHYLRRIEYFSLFFVFFSSVKTKRMLKIYTILIVLTTVGIAIYGFGQKYLYWPAYSTMNREFAKGWMLYLTSHARVLSTFGGHYDLAAFIMMVLILFWSLFFGIRKLLWKIILLSVIAAAFWTLILTASRTSFIAYLFGLCVMFFFWSFKKGLQWSIPRMLLIVTISIVFMLSFGDLSERFTKLLHIDERLKNVRSLLFSPIGSPPRERAIFLENNPDALAQITSKTDQPPTPDRPSDVYQDIPLMIPSTTGSASVSAVSRTYSRTAFQYDLSTAIRFDALWPMAINGFKRNPLLGSGFSTLNKLQNIQFTEAESTDNDYLRSLGETGILGFVTFFGTVFFILYFIWRYLTVLRDPVAFSVSVGVAGLIAGLLVNGLYIDVFESSKVAFSFWAFAGITLAGIVKAKEGKKSKIPLPVIYDFKDFKIMNFNRLRKFATSDLFFLLLVLSIAFALRIYKINTPLADWHSWRQADTASVTRNFVNKGINFLYPTYDDLSNIASGIDNPKGLRFVEFPLYNAASVVTDKLLVGMNIEITSRLTSVFASLTSLVFIFLLMRKYRSRLEAFTAAIIFAVLPYNIFYSRVILPEPLLIAASTGMIYFWDKWIDRIQNPQLPSLSRLKRAERIQNYKAKIKSFIIFFFALFFTVFAVLIKPYAIFLFLPMAYIWIRAFGYSVKSIIGLLVYWFIGLLPFFWWRWWISHFPEGIPASYWLLNGDNIRFKGAFFFWIFADRIGRLILGYWGIFFVVSGIIAGRKKEGWLFYCWGISILLYLTVFATGNVRHDYYQTLSIPIISIFIATGIHSVIEYARLTKSIISALILIGVSLVFMEMFGWYHIRDFYNINHPEIVEAGRVVEIKTPDKSIVIAPYNGDTAFLYQTKRAGWPILQDSIENMIKKGAHYYVSANFDDITKQIIQAAVAEDPAKRKYKLIELTDKYVIIQLVPDNKLPK